MSHIPNMTELNLSGRAPAGLDTEFLSRLTACAEGTFTDLSPWELEFELSLRQYQPARLSGNQHAALLETIGETPFSMDGKIVLFHKGPTEERKVVVRASFRRHLTAAAAVALFGSLAALLIPNGGQAPLADRKTPDTSPLATLPFASPTQVAPISFGSKLSETRDEGIVWRGKNQPHRVLRLTYTEQVITKDAAGNTVRTEQPRVEYMIVPEKID